MKTIEHSHKRPNPRSVQPSGVALQPEHDEMLLQLTRELLAARTRAQLTQEDVAWRMGTTKSAISRLEGQGGHRPSFATIEKYALAVGCGLKIRLRPLPLDQG